MKIKKFACTAAAIAVVLTMWGGYAPHENAENGISVTASAASAAALPAPGYVYHQCYGYGPSAYLSWAEVKGADFYYVYRYDSTKKKYVIASKTTDNYYYAENLTSGKKYIYKIAAVKKSGGKNVVGNKSKMISFTAEKYDEGRKVSVSKSCKFYDFKIRDLDGKAVSVSSSAAKKAVSLVKKSAYYSESMIDVDSYISSDSAEIKKYLNSAGTVEPKASKAYTYDYDGDGKKESFILVELPFLSAPNPVVGTVLVYCDSEGKMTVMDRFYFIEDGSFEGEYYGPKLIDYGDFKQLFIGGGTMGANEFYGIYGERNGKVKCYAESRCMISKNGCLLNIDAFQGMGGTYYFDTAADEYRGIKGVPIDTEKVRKMDTAGELPDYGEGYYFTLIGGKYYIYNGMFGVYGYIYKNGKFVYDENGPRSFNGGVIFAENYVEDIDLDHALKNMIKVK
ncbi:MAG: hypothetical protein ACI4J5_07715 [Oscillospiraceae bacterium]